MSIFIIFSPASAEEEEEATACVMLAYLLRLIWHFFRGKCSHFLPSGCLGFCCIVSCCLYSFYLFIVCIHIMDGICDWRSLSSKRAIDSFLEVLIGTQWMNISCKSPLAPVNLVFWHICWHAVDCVQVACKAMGFDPF